MIFVLIHKSLKIQLNFGHSPRDHPSRKIHMHLNETFTKHNTTKEHMLRIFHYNNIEIRRSPASLFTYPQFYLNALTFFKDTLKFLNNLTITTSSK